MRPNWLSVMAFTAIMFGSALPACAQQPIGAIEDWITPADFPGEDGIKDYGSASFDIMIKPDGTVGTCKILRKTISQTLADLTCKAITAHARYQPAGDHEGKAINGRDLLGIVWTGSPLAPRLTSTFGGSIPLGSPGHWATDLDYNRIVANVGNITLGIKFFIGPAGRITRCGAYPESTHKKLEDYTCALVASRASFIQPVDKMGQPLTTFTHTYIKWAKPQ